MHNLLMVMSSENSRQHTFYLLVLFRWLSLIPPLAALLFATEIGMDQARLIAAFFCAIAVNVIISLFATSLNHALESHPWILGLDLLFVGGLLTITGGWRSPYYLYVLNPLLAAAFFFQVRGAILAVSSFLPVYFVAVLLDVTLFDGANPQWMVIVVFCVGSYLISVAMGYVSLLLAQLQSTQDSLYRAHSELAVLHELSTSLQRSANMEDVQKKVLGAITHHLGFQRSVMGLVDQQEQSIGNWQAKDREYEQPVMLVNVGPVSLQAEDNLIAQALSGGHIERFNMERRSITFSEDADTNVGEPIISQESNQKYADYLFGMSDGLVLPLIWGVQPVGVLLIELTGQEDGAKQLKALDAIARQTAVSLGMMMTRLRRAKESAKQEERTRIALDLHDTISQSLFGLVYTLQGSLKLLSSNPQAIKPELEWALATAEDVRQKIRATIHNMWPEDLTAEKFEDDLRTYTADVLQATDLKITFDIRGEFNTLSPPARRSMYRICQESLTNIVHHAAAHQSRICVDVADGRARFILRDDGRGFEPTIAMAQTHEEDHFGLRGMRERAAALGGTCEIYSQPHAGTSIVIDIPANAQAHHE